MSRRYVGGITLLAILALTSGLTWPVGKLALREIDPWTLKTITVVGSGMLLLVIAHFAGHAMRPSRRDIVSLTLVAAFNISAWHLLVAFGLRVSDAAHAVIIAFTMPVWATVLSVWLLGETVRAQSILAFGLVVGGLVVLVGGNIKDIADDIVGLVLLLLAAVSWAYGTIRQKQLKTDLSLTAVAGWQLLIGAVPITFGMVIWGSSAELPRVPPAALAATCFVLVSMVFIYWAWFRVVEIFPAHVASMGTAATPVFGVVASRLILDEELGPEEWGALAFIVTGLPLLTLQKWPEFRKLRSEPSDGHATWRRFPSKDGRRQ